ncbi:histidine phosphatase [Mucidula mucida]|nr:histidine phosphatase [Mucidula mucida]
MFVAVLLLSAGASYAFNPIHYAPSTTTNISYVMNGTTDAPGIFNSSQTPDALYGVYNWCNMPHVRAREYITPSDKYTLEYVEVIQRHHKRTPYGSNTFFKEDVSWSCEGSGPVHYAKSTTGPRVAEIQWQAYGSAENPWTSTVGPGFVDSTCQFPQITTEGLWDAYIHGVDLRKVYARRLNLSSKLETSAALVRVTNNVITSQVAGGLVRGLFPDTHNAEVHIERDGIDSLEPSLDPCDNLVKPGITDKGAGDGGVWTGHLEAAASLYEKLDAVSGIDSEDTAGWHTWFDHYYDNLSAKQCHGFSLPCSVNDTSLCVTQDEANNVYRLGNWEYSYIYRDSANSTVYSTMVFGAWLLELKEHLNTARSGTNPIKYFHNVGHDGSISALLGFLQVDHMVWPGMGSEVVFELYSKDSAYYIRVLWSGQPIVTSTPLRTLDMIAMDEWISYIDDMVGTGAELYQACNA